MPVSGPIIKKSLLVLFQRAVDNSIKKLDGNMISCAMFSKFTGNLYFLIYRTRITELGQLVFN